MATTYDMETLTGIGKDDLTPRERGVGFIRHFTSLMLERRGDIFLTVDGLGRNDFDALPGEEFPGMYQWGKNVPLPASEYGTTWITFYTNEPPV